MNTPQHRQLIHPNHEHLTQLTLVFLVVFGSLIMGLVPLVFGLALTDAHEDNFMLPTEAELWKPLGEAIE
ncbi:MAG: hypothetical protein QNJ72_11780 [Pleurocapsa sp. MO_226.B13]|nr:hypothetical protein [Pleurocapsa sp. MO_226.B13]